MKKCLYAAFILLLSLTLVDTAFAEKEPYGDIRVPITQFALDNFDQTSQIEAGYYYPLSDGFFTYNEDQSIKPQIINKYKVSRDGLIWTFYIQKGVKFHNGDVLTAEDAKWSFDRFAACQNVWANKLRDEMVSTELVDQYTFRYKLKKPQPWVVHPIAAARVYPKKYFESGGKTVEEQRDKFNKFPLGSGPWKYVSKDPGKQVIFEANTDHWLSVPHFKRLIYIAVPEETTRVAMFKRGDLDTCAPITYDTADKLKKEGYRLKSGFFPTMQNLQFSGTWLTENPTKDLRIRKAMSYAINRQQMADTYFKGFAKPAPMGFAAGPQSFGWKSSWKPDPYDPELAKKLIKEAGYPEKFKDPVVRLITSPGWGPINNDVMLMVADFWKAVGLQVKIESVDLNQLFGYTFVRASKPSDPSWPIVGAIWSFPFGATPFNGYHLFNLFNSKGAHTTLNDPKADELFEKMMTESNQKKAVKYYQEFVDYCNAQYIHFNTVGNETLTALGKNIGDWEWGWHTFSSFQFLTHAK